MNVKTIAVIGAGTMGRGIAYAAALGGYNTVLEDISRSMLEQAVSWIRQSFDEGVAKGKVEAGVRDKALSLISNASNVEDAIRDADLIIEAVPEELEMKLELFTQLGFELVGAEEIQKSVPHVKLLRLNQGRPIRLLSAAASSVSPASDASRPRRSTNSSARAGCSRLASIWR